LVFGNEKHRGGALALHLANYLSFNKTMARAVFLTIQTKHMKKIFFPLVLSVLAAFTASAQLTLRPFVGINSSSLTDIDTANFDSQIGYQLGADLQIGSKFYVQPGLQFEFVKNTIDPRTGEESDYKRTNLRIPVLVGYAFGAGTQGNWGFRIFTGPNATFNLSDKPEDESAFDDLDLENIIWGWNAGVGVDFISILFLDLGYQFGLSDVFTDLDDSPRNNLFYANAGLRIRF
jgi:opacity protein-like surface antigen